MIVWTAEVRCSDRSDSKSPPDRVDLEICVRQAPVLSPESTTSPGQEVEQVNDVRIAKSIPEEKGVVSREQYIEQRAE